MALPRFRMSIVYRWHGPMMTPGSVSKTTPWRPHLGRGIEPKEPGSGVHGFVSIPLTTARSRRRNTLFGGSNSVSRPMGLPGRTAEKQPGVVPEGSGVAQSHGVSGFGSNTMDRFTPIFTPRNPAPARQEGTSDGSKDPGQSGHHVTGLSLHLRNLVKKRQYFP